MSAIDSVTLEAEDPSTAAEFYAALGVSDHILVTAGSEPTNGFRSYTLSLVCSQPANVNLYLQAGIDAGGQEIKPAAKSMWGYGGTLRAPDGAIWTVATSKKKDSSAAAQTYDDLVLLLGAADVGASKRFYTEHGLSVSKSYVNRYVEFATGESAVKLGLSGLKALAKNAGVPADGSGSHRIVIHGDAGACVDPDGFIWEPAA